MHPSTSPGAAVPSSTSLSEEEQLMTDPRLAEAVALFNQGDWYACHDGFEALWHETAGPMRPVLQGILQLAVAQLHLQRGNQRGALVLTGEGLGRLARCPADALGLDLSALCSSGRQWLLWLQGQAASQGAAPSAGQPKDAAAAPAPAQPRLEPSGCVQSGLSAGCPPA